MLNIILDDSNEDEFIKFLANNRILAFDTETTGLLPYHGDRIFAFVVSNGETSWYLRDFNKWLRYAFDGTEQIWVLHNAKFDMHFLYSNYKTEIAGTIRDTMVMARLEYNDHMSYSLDACAARIGLKKLDVVEEYIQKNSLWEWQVIPGKKVRRKLKFFYKVPEEIMVPYACEDARVTFKLYEHLLGRLKEIDALLPEAPGSLKVLDTESQVTKAVFDMESYGCAVDVEYSEYAFNHYKQKEQGAMNEFKKETGRDYKPSPKLFSEVFAGEMEKWAYTEKGNPSFESDILKRFDNPGAKQVLTIRNAKSRCDFFAGFSFHSDSSSYIHPNFNQAGTATGRFSSSEPNFQNLTNDEESKEECPTRAAIVPPDENYCLVSMDYDQQEYRMMLDYAGELELIEQVKSGVDVHQATADLMGVSRKYAKTLNFMLLYGGGAGKLAEALDITGAQARDLKQLYFSKLPKVQNFITTVINTAKQRGYVYNWAGRRYFCDPDFAYKMPNRIIQGGGADVMKQAIVKISELLKTTESTIALTIHDELDFYIHKNEFHLIPKIKAIMEGVFPSRHLPLTVSISHSWDNLASLKDGAPTPLESAAKTIANKWPGWRPRPPSKFDSLLNAFGLPKTVGYDYESYAISTVSGGLRVLHGIPKDGPVKMLARVEPQVLAYNCKNLGIDFSEYEK